MDARFGYELEDGTRRVFAVRDCPDVEAARRMLSEILWVPVVDLPLPR